jgi:hypothetical protein
MSQSTLNSYRGPILAGGSFTGIPEVINGSISIVCLIRHTVDVVLNVFQSPDGVSYILSDTFNASVPLQGNQSRVQFYTKGQKGYIQVQNLGIVNDPDVILRTLYTPNNHDGTKLQPTYVSIEGTIPIGPISGTVEVSKIVDPLPTGTNALGSVSVSNFPATQPVSGTVAVSSIASALPAGTNALGSVSVSNFPVQQLVSGENSNFEFYPTPANNTSAIYADGTQGTNVSGGWKYTNAITGKINWYCYSSPSAEKDYKVSQLNSMYTVVNQQSTLGLATAQNPFIIIYTRPTSTATTWYQNKFFFGSNALTDTTGVRLLYTGSDPVGVHPEIVAPNRIQLDFKPLLSTSTLALSQNESVWLGSLQTTNNTTPAGSFDFTMQEFGVDWVKSPSVLPIEFNSVVVSGTVAVSSIVSALPVGTNSIGSVVVSNLPATQPVSGTVAVSSIASALPAGSNALGSVSVSNFPAQTLITGENSNFEFYPTSANNTPAIYADGTQGVNVSSGWQYSNVANVGKINWYCYSSPTAETDYKVSQLNSMYTVINQQSTLGLSQAQNPFIIIYTRPTSTVNWYQNKLFFGSNAGTDTTGIKLLYTGSDPVGVHPEIVAPNRIQLDFNLSLSTTTLALAQDEGIFLGSLQTTNNTPIGNSFSFTMVEFGADWVIAPAILPIEFGSVVVSGKVGLTSTLNTATYNQVVNAFGFQGTAYDMGDNSLVDILLLATGTIATGIIRLDYSIDGTTWIQNNTTNYTISSTDPHLTIIGLKTGSRYIRVSAGTSSLFSATNLRTIYSSKRS